MGGEKKVFLQTLEIQKVAKDENMLTLQPHGIYTGIS